MPRKLLREDDPIKIWNYGGGVQTAAIGVLICEGRIEKPDLTFIADTGRETQSTWDYLQNVMQPLMDQAGIQIEIVPHSEAIYDLYSEKGDVQLPVYTSEGKLRNFCSGNWKRDVVTRRIRREYPKHKCVQFIGFSKDEERRVFKQRRQWLDVRFPLIELGLTRNDCLQIIHKAGLSIPAKSACWMCPNRDDNEWLWIKQHYPDEWEKAIELDREVRQKDELNDMYLHHSRIPLELVELNPKAKSPHDKCESGICWV